ncbi:MAG TPA: hypothetical protein VMY77_18050 [Chitinophagaceae bacterium]|nr:hypothetical protein [Chitinophagaceae bacterium]
MQKKIGSKPLKIYVVNRDDRSIKDTLQKVLPNSEWEFFDSFSGFMEECRKNGHPFFN